MLCAIVHSLPLSAYDRFQVTEATRERGELWGGARINDIFRGEYFDSLQVWDL